MDERLPRNSAGSLAPEEIEIARRRLTLLRSILAGLAGGIIIFAVVACVFGNKLILDLPPAPLSMICAGLGILLAFQSLVFPAIIRRRVVADPGSDRLKQIENLCSGWLGSRVVGMAMMESAAILNLVAVMIEGNLLNFAVGILALGGMVLHFPTRNSLLDWLESRLRG